MRKTIYTLTGVISLMFLTPALAQLPANPWAAQPQVTSEATTTTTAASAGASVGHISASNSSPSRVYIPSIKYAPVTAEAAPPTYKPAVISPSYKDMIPNNNSSGNYAMKRSDSAYAIPRASAAYNGDWRGSGQFGKLGYTGQVTTYDKAQGQEMIAPEVNNNNMNIMVQHLRKLGYKIPSSYDNGFSNFLQNYSSDLRTAYSGLGHRNNPIDKMFSSIVGAFENFTGLDAGNLMFNSLDLIQRN
ncbi:MAG: hypothetical protein IKK52_01115 [Alphaproteobacteria bacterium]|nr:hypothetical protein [Alphaproteobacteria bacterium]